MVSPGIILLDNLSKIAIVSSFPPAPDSPPDPVVGAALYWRLCSSCHRVDGSADTEEARKLTPRPRPFQDPEVLAALSPVRAFNVMTFGLAGTGMASFKALPVRDRWNLAFHVYSFHHGPRTPAEKPAGLIEPGLAALSTRTDAELRAQLEAAGIEAG
ncbi:MAG: hypothetical protein HUU38_07440, partial [Anaerolineales bacterium]|nr:hypothetical protein [Anaerolineales bacterium]